MTPTVAPIVAVIPPLPQITNPFDPNYAQVGSANATIQEANLTNSQNAASYLAAMHTYDDAFIAAGGKAPANMPLPQPAPYRHVNVVTDPNTGFIKSINVVDGPDPVVPAEPLPVVNFVPSGTGGGISAPSTDPVQQILTGLGMAFPLIQQTALDVAAIKAKVGA